MGWEVGKSAMPATTPTTWKRTTAPCGVGLPFPRAARRCEAAKNATVMVEPTCRWYCCCIAYPTSTSCAAPGSVPDTTFTRFEVASRGRLATVRSPLGTTCPSAVTFPLTYHVEDRRLWTSGRRANAGGRVFAEL